MPIEIPFNPNKLVKWRYYIALLSQSGTGAPVARVLNACDDDYLGNIVWGRSEAGSYVGTLNGSFPNKMLNFSGHSLLWTETKYYDKNKALQFLSSTENQILLKTFLGDYSLDDVLLDTYLEIKVRQRGQAPTLLFAETNTTGDKLILHFNDVMNDFFFQDIAGEFIAIIEGIGTDVIAVNRGTDTKTIELTLDGWVEFGNMVTLDFDALVALESACLGLLAAFSGFPVTNGVPSF